ncbi:hypothetical protein CCR75_001765 [Bremia lactucae]|uniref:Uncharacterized protein n=1 Tax=Bremia lactucae TaxID=4779 RepID=A0A976FRH1_BRELC|nr:hypothetical protein CCR75_001765 [Bremia lactucae]
MSQVPSDFRVTEDYTRVNSLSVPIAGVIPDMRTVAARVAGCIVLRTFRQLLWCGKLLGEYVRLLCAANWLSESVIEYACVTAPLYDKLNVLLKSAGRNKRIASGIAVLWSESEMEVYDTFLNSLARSAQLQHPSS